MSLPAAFFELFLEDVPLYTRRSAVWLGARVETWSAFAIKRALILITVAGILLLAVIAFFMAAAGHNPIDVQHWLGEEPTAEDLRNYFWAVGLPLGAVIVLVTLVNALRRTRALEQQVLTDSARVSLAEREFDASTSARRDEFNAGTFAKALELLGSESEIKRVGAVYALEDLMRAAFSTGGDGARLGRQIGDTLAAYVRRGATRGEGGDGIPVDSAPELSSALVAIARSWPPEMRPELDQEGGVDLRSIDLGEWSFPNNSDISRFRFDRSNLRELGHFMRAEGASFTGCDLSGAFFLSSKFIKCGFMFADFTSGNFVNSEMCDCDLSFSDFSDSNFNGMKIYRCDWNGASLNDVKIQSVKITDSDNDWFLNISNQQIQSAIISDKSDLYLPDRLIKS